MNIASIVVAASALLLSSMAGAAEIRAISTLATKEAYLELVAQFEKSTGHKVATDFNGTANVQKALADGGRYDLVIMVNTGIDQEIKQGRAVADSRIDFAASGTGVAVRKGAPKPDVSSPDALRKTLLAAKSVGISTGPSGVYLLTMFEKLGIAEQMKAKLKQSQSGLLVGNLLVSGEAEVGLQQIPELVHFEGVDYVGPLPGDLQQMTMFSIAIHAGAAQGDAARALAKFITAPAAAPVIRKHGLVPG